MYYPTMYHVQISEYMGTVVLKHIQWWMYSDLLCRFAVLLYVSSLFHKQQHFTIEHSSFVDNSDDSSISLLVKFKETVYHVLIFSQMT